MKQLTLFLLLLLPSACLFAQQTQDEITLDSLTQQLNNRDDSIYSHFTSFQKLRGGVLFNSEHGLFSLTDSYLFRLKPRFYAGPGAGFEYSHSNGGDFRMLSLPVMLTMHFHYRGPFYTIVEPMLVIPLKVVASTYQGEDMTQPLSDYPPGFSIGGGTGYEFTDYLALELYLRYNLVNYKNFETNSYGLIGLNLSYSFH